MLSAVARAFREGSRVEGTGQRLCEGRKDNNNTVDLKNTSDLKYSESQPGSVPMPSNAEIVREACQVVWTEGRADRVADYYAADFVACR